MKYFDSYINICEGPLYEKGILKVKDNDFFVNDILVVNLNRCMEGDLVILRKNDSRIVNVVKRQTEKIVGILLCDSKYKFGKKDDKKNIYLFQPTKSWFPLFYVASSHEYGPKKYCVVEFKRWDVEDKYPWGDIIETIGLVGKDVDEYEHLRCYYGFYNTNWKMKKECIDSLEKNMNDLCNKSNPKYTNVFSIDPIGCEDIDDAFHINVLENGLIEIGVHIASPTTFFEENIQTVLSRVSTIYLPNRKINMLPSIFATSFYSLLPDKVRPTVSFIFLFESNYNLVEKKVEESFICNKKAYHYDEFQEKVMNQLDLNNSKQIFCKLSNHFFGKVLDSHSLVEEWMLYVNSWVAENLVQKNLQNVVLRVQPKPLLAIDETKSLTKFTLTTDSTEITEKLVLNEYLKRQYMESAKYIVYNEHNKNCYTSHSSLNKQFYTHFTSPIRRSIDFWNHLLIRGSLIENPSIINEYIDHINDFMKRTRKMQRMINRLEFLFKLNNKQDCIEVDGFIVKIYDRKIRIYIPEFELEENIYLYNYKSFVLLENFCLKEDDSGIITNIHFKQNDVEVDLNLYQKLRVQLFIFPKEKNIFQKCKIKIIS